MDRTTKMSRQTRAELLVFIVALGVLALTCIACPPPSVQTPAGKTAYAADQVVLRIGELQTAAIDANAAGELSTETTRHVVQFTVDAAKTLKASPDGWHTTVGPAYVGMKNQLAPAERARLGPYLGILDAIMENAR